MWDELLDRLRGITEDRELEEMSKKGVLTMIDVYVKHLLWYFENKGKDDHAVTDALEGMQTALTNAEKHFNDMPGKVDRRVLRVTGELLQAFEDGVRRFRKQYKVTPKSEKGSAVVSKALNGFLKLEDIGIEVVELPHRKIKLVLRKDWM